MSASLPSTKLLLPRAPEISAWRARVVEDAYEAMQVRVPEKILALNARLARMSDAEGRWSEKGLRRMEEGTDVRVYPAEPEPDARAGQGKGKKRKLASAGAGEENGEPEEEEGVLHGRVLPNKWFGEAFEELRSEWADLISIMDAIKLFISLNIPATEEGDNGGVATQEEALNEVARSQETGYNWLSTPCGYYSGRGEAAGKVVRFPGVEDYRLALHEYDRRAALRLKAQFTDLRNTYAVVLDILEKNMKRIAQPKSGNAMANYG